RVEIGERGKPGGEVFHFIAASPAGIEGEVGSGEFKLLRGYILMARFDWAVVYRSIENIINHARGYRDHNWDEVIEFFSRYGRYDSEDIHS
ncbi:MAG TPA: Imm8 family immunity protein, partial [Pyrinomonadaceae bacterium]